MAEVRAEDGWHEHVVAAGRGLLERVSAEILADADALVPVDTGRLRQSLDREVVGDTARIGSVDVEYSIYVEEGTRHMAAQPYLRPALYRQRGA